MSQRCAPTPAVPAALSGSAVGPPARDAAILPLPSPAPPASREAIGHSRAIRTGGNPIDHSGRQRPAQARDQAHACGGRRDRMPRHRVLQSGEPSRVPTLAAPAAGCARSSPRHALRSPAHGPAPVPIPAGPGNGGARTLAPKQPVHLRGEPDCGDPRGDFRLAARRRAVHAENTPIGRSFGQDAGPISTGPAAVANRPPTAQRPLRRARREPYRRSAPSAARVRAPAAKSPPADWSCRCRSDRTAR